jgi:YHS domain-containing protein
MRRIFALALIFAAAGCGGSSKPSRAAQSGKHSDMKTIDSADVRPAVMDPPPVLTEEAPPPKLKDNLAQADAPPPPTPQDEALRASLPFAPAIGMDPVDGSKISIRASTPVTEYKNKIFYFSSEENKRIFLSNPEQYSKGPFSHL